MARKIFFSLVIVLSSAAAVFASGDMGYWGWKNCFYRDVSLQKQFFIDDAIIEEMQGLKRVVNQAKFYDKNPVIECDQPWEKDLYIEQYGSIFYDQQEKIFKIWYQLLDWDRTVRFLAYATSKDGIEWQKPNLGVVEYKGSKENNLVFGPPSPPTKEEVQIDPHLQKAYEGKNTSLLAPAGEPIKDLAETDPAKRYKMLYRGPPALTHYMVNAAYSPDGIHWTPYPVGINPVIPLRSDSSCNVFWDPSIDRYVAILRMFQPFGAEKDKLYSHPEKYKGPLMRIVGRSISKDFVNWTPAKVIVSPDEKDGIDHGQLHDMEVMLYEGVYFGFLGVMHKDPNGYGKVSEDVQLAFSRDGINWHRTFERKPILPFKGKEWITVLQGPIVVGDEVWIYYTGLESAYWPNPMPAPRGKCVSQALGLAKIRLDGFISVEAGSEEGVLVTQPFVFKGNQLEINADAAGGEITVEILELKNTYYAAEVEPIPGFTRADCKPIKSDSVRNVVSWKNGSDLSSIKNRIIKLKFYLRNAKLYSFQFKSTKKQDETVNKFPISYKHDK